MQQIHQVIIIGAGVSGIGASRTLSKEGIPHIILESRDRFGGRITSTQFAGVNVELGANYIHMPQKKNNLITKFVNQNKIQTIKALLDSQVYYYEGEGIMKDKFVDRAQKLFGEADNSIEKKTQKSNHDISLLQAFKDFNEDVLKEQDKHVQDAVFWILNIVANDEGCELSNLSAKTYIQQEDTSVEELIPSQGYSYVFKKLMQSCKGQFIYNTKVVSVDMTGNIIILKTQDNKVFKAKKVISSIPLGLLQRNLVHFNPPLPQPYQKAISSIGSGICNKLFCSFKKPFWGNRKGWMNFVMKNQKVGKFPVAFIVPDPKNHIIVFEVGITACLELGKMADQQIFKEFDNYLSLFIKREQYQLEQVMMTKWHLDENTFGCYAYSKVGTTTDHFNQLRKPVQKRFWFIGEHTNAQSTAFVQGALETGIWAAEEAIKRMQN